VETLILNGANVNAVERYAFTFLHKAAGNGHTDVAELLILNGADVTLLPSMPLRL